MVLENNKNFQAAKQIFTAYLENKQLRKTPERYAILEEIYSFCDISTLSSLSQTSKRLNSLSKCFGNNFREACNKYFCSDYDQHSFVFNTASLK